MSRLKAWTLIGLVVLTGALSLGNDCNVRVNGDGLRVDVDDEEDNFFNDLEDLFD
jgi:hypothetical protein